MSIADEGGFDMVMEVAQTLLLEIAGSVNIPTESTTLTFQGITGNLTTEALIDQVTLGAFPNLNVGLDVSGTTFDATSVPVFLSPVPNSLRTVTLSGNVSATVPLGVSGFALGANFDQAKLPVVSQDVFNSVLAAPLIQFLLAETFLIDPTGALYSQTVQNIRSALTSALQAPFVAVGSQIVFDASSLRGVGTGLTNFDFSFGNQSIFLQFTFGGAGGAASAISRSNLLRTPDGTPVDRADLIISNACILRDFIKPTLMLPPGAGGLGLTAGGFAPPVLFGGAPLAWSGSAPFPAAVTGPISSASIDSVVVGIDGANFRILLNATANGVAGSFSVSASIDITLSLGVSINGTTVTFTLTPVGSPVVSSNVSIAWWVYVLGFVTGGFTLDVIIAVANAFGGNLANSIISGSVAGAIPSITITFPLPPGLPTLSVRSTSLSQTDAPPSAVLIAGFFFLNLPFPQNDIIVDVI